jgi:hypothetical protein
MAQTTSAVTAHLPIAGLTALVIDYVWEPSSLENAHWAEFYEACDELTTNANVNVSLQMACVAGNEDIIRMTIDKGAYAFDLGLMAAAIYGRVAAARMMIDRGAAATSAVMKQAATYGHLPIVQLLIHPGIDWNAAYHAAYYNNHEHIVIALINAQTPRPYASRVIIKKAVERGHVAVVQMCVNTRLAAHLSRHDWSHHLDIARAEHHDKMVDYITTILDGHD